MLPPTQTTTSTLLLLLFSLLFLPILHAQQVMTSSITTLVPSTTITNYIAAPTTPPSPEYTDSLTLRTSILNSTNLFRHQHNASYIPWNDTLAAYAADYAAECVWAHSHGPEGYGENLARGYPDISSAVDAWGNERDLYTFAPPDDVTGFSEETGHFTQLVWKSTQSVGCGVYECAGNNGVDGWMLVCEYWPAGNVEMATSGGGGGGNNNNENLYFEANVQAQVVEGTEGFDVMSATVGATGVTAWATGTLEATAVVSGGGTSGGGRVAVGDAGAVWALVVSLIAVGVGGSVGLGLI